MSVPFETRLRDAWRTAFVRVFPEVAPIATLELLKIGVLFHDLQSEDRSGDRYLQQVASMRRAVEEWASRYSIRADWLVTSAILGLLVRIMEERPLDTVKEFHFATPSNTWTLIEIENGVLSIDEDGNVSPLWNLDQLMDDIGEEYRTVYAPEFQETWVRSEEKWSTFEKRAVERFLDRIRRSARANDPSEDSSIDGPVPVNMDQIRTQINVAVNWGGNKREAERQMGVDRTTIISRIRAVEKILFPIRD